MTSLPSCARRDVFRIGLGIFACQGAVAAVLAKPKSVSLPEIVKVKDVVDGDTLALTDGRELRLVGIQAPKIAYRRKDGRMSGATWPFAGEARKALADLCIGRKLRLAYEGTPTDRYDRLLAHAFLSLSSGEVWLQERMVAQGFARVYTFADNHARSEPLLLAERTARHGRLGLWAHPNYAIRQAQDVEKLGRLIGRFELVQGKVQKTAEMGRRVYINFGDDYRRDFTVTIEGRNRRLFKKSFDPLQLGGRIIRVRGWLRWINGPSLEVTHPQQIEIIS